MPSKKYYNQTKKFFILDDLDKKEIIYNTIKRHKLGDTAYGIARKSGCSPETARRYLKWFVTKGMVLMRVIGRYKIYVPKGLKKKTDIRLYIEKKTLDDRNI